MPNGGSKSPENGRCQAPLTVKTGKGKRNTYLDITGEDDLLEMPPENSHLLSGDPRAPVGREAVARCPLFTLSICSRHRVRLVLLRSDIQL
jgi:hypothetical protein